MTDGNAFRGDGDGDFVGRLTAVIDADGGMNTFQGFARDPLFHERIERDGEFFGRADKPNIGGFETVVTEKGFEAGPVADVLVCDNHEKRMTRQGQSPQTFLRILAYLRMGTRM